MRKTILTQNGVLNSLLRYHIISFKLEKQWGGGGGDLGWKTELLGHYDKHETFIKHIIISNIISIIIIILLLKHYVSRCILKFD